MYFMSCSRMMAKAPMRDPSCSFSDVPLARRYLDGGARRDWHKKGGDDGVVQQTTDTRNALEVGKLGEQLHLDRWRDLDAVLEHLGDTRHNVIQSDALGGLQLGDF